jgi:hypothetical protein
MGIFLFEASLFGHLQPTSFLAQDFSQFVFWIFFSVWSLEQRGIPEGRVGFSFLGFKKNTLVHRTLFTNLFFSAIVHHFWATGKREPNSSFRNPSQEGS